MKKIVVLILICVSACRLVASSMGGEEAMYIDLAITKQTECNPLPSTDTSSHLVSPPLISYNSEIPLSADCSFSQHNQILYPSALLDSMEGMIINQIRFFYTCQNEGVSDDLFEFEEFVDLECVDIEDSALSDYGRAVYWSVSLGETNDTALQGINTSVALTNVYNGILSWEPNSDDLSSGAIVITFNEPYAYNGGNLLLDVSVDSTYGAVFDGESYVRFSGQYTYSGSSVSSILRDGIVSEVSQQDFLPETQFVFSEDSICQVPMHITVDSLWFSGVQLSWDSVEPGGSFLIEYGPTGFGQGRVVETTSYSVTITDLIPSVFYNFRLRTICSEGDSSLWVTTSLSLPYPTTPYWSDVVTIRPDGFQMDSNNIYIFTAEGLAWLISVCNHLNGETSFNQYNVYLLADVDMSEYIWKPLVSSNSSINFNGLGHTITGLTIYGAQTDECSVGFIRLNRDTIRNVYFRDCKVCAGERFVGCIAGYNQGVIIDCGVSGIVSAASSVGVVGGMVGFNTSEIINCFSVADVSGRHYVGGLVGETGSDLNDQFEDEPHVLYNCYSASDVYSFQDSNFSLVLVGSGSYGGFPNYRLQSDSEIYGNSYPFSGSDLNWTLSTDITIGGETVSSLLSALNAWVDNQDSTTVFCRWTVDSNYLNNGYPLFEIDYCNLTIHCQDSIMGKVMGGGVFVENSVTQINAIASNCYRFSSWSDGCTENPRCILVNQDSVLTALFVPIDTSRVYGVGRELITACDYFDWKDSLYTQSGLYVFDTLTTLGCDSVVTLDLTINHSDLDSRDTVSACDYYTWKDSLYTQSGLYVFDTLTTLGCDSVVTLDLTINHSDLDSRDSVSACDYYAWKDSLYTQSGLYVFDTLTTLGCDSVVTLDLTINYSDSNSLDTIVSCGVYMLNGNSYAEGGWYAIDTITTKGCDSTISMFLILYDDIYPEVDSITACDSYVWNGVTYTASGVYSFDTVTSHGCDSTSILNLVIAQSTYISDTVEACQSYIWNGVNYTESGLYSFDSISSRGCDSIVTLNLIIFSVENNSIVQTVCDSMIWHNNTYFMDGVYTFETIDSNGCTQVDSLFLTVNNSAVTDVEMVLSSAAIPYEYWGTVIEESGSYIIHLETLVGCDSIINLNVMIENVGIGSVLENSNVVLYPNPTTGILNVSMIENVNSIEIYDAVGRRLLKSARTDVLDLSELSDGQYILKLTLDQGPLFKKIIKQ